MTSAFDAILGNRELLEALGRPDPQEHAGRVYLFAGPNGVGKTTAAKALSASVLGLHPTERELFHPDLLLVDAEKNLQGKSLISVEKARNVRRFLAQTPSVADAKVVLIEQGEALSTEAANTLLKTLEEPPAFGLVIICAENIFHLLPTIRSRAIPVRFLPMTDASLESGLLRLGFSASAVADVLPLAQGLPGRAIALLNDKGLFQQTKRASEEAQRFLHAGHILRLASTADIKRAGLETLGSRIDGWIVALRTQARVGETEANILLTRLLDAKRTIHHTNSAPDLVLDNALVGTS